MIQRETLKKDMSLLGLFTLAFGTIIGVGWMTVLGSWLTDAGSVGAIIGFVAGGIIMLIIGLYYAETAAMYPVSGGEVAYIYEMFGTRLSFVVGWFLALDYIGVTSFEAISVAWLLSALFPGFEGPVVYTVLGYGVKLWGLVASLAIMGVIIIFNYRGVKAMVILQSGLTFTLLAATLVFIIGGIFWGETANLEPTFQGVGASGAIVGILAVMATAPFWFSGFDTISQAMGEIRENTKLKKLPMVIALAIGLAALFYCLIILSASMSLPREDLLSHDLPVAAALIAVFHSEWMGKLVLFAGLCGLITTWNAIFFAASRVIFALARAHMIPHIFAKVHNRFGSPHLAVLFVGAVGTLGALFGRNAILPIVDASALILAAIFVTIIIGVARLRRRLPDHSRPYRVPGGTPFLILAALAAGGVLFLAISEPLKTADGKIPVEWIVLGGWAVLGLVFWVASRRMRHSVNESERRYLILEESEEK